MGTVASLIESARYDLADYEEGLDFDDRILFNHVNRMIGIMDSQLASLDSELVYATEEDIDTVADQNYIDLTNMNNGNWDRVKEVWIGSDRKQQISVDLLNYKRKFRSGSAEPEYWALQGRRILFEVDADDAHTDVVIHYQKKHRPVLESFTDTFTAVAATDVCTMASGAHTFVTGDGPFTVSNSGGGLPGGLSVSTNYYIILDPDDTDGFLLATTKDNALAGTDIDITTTGTGTHTITMGDDLMPYDGRFDELFREMLVLHSMTKRGQESPNATYTNLFRKRAMEETIRRNTIPKYYYIDY
jgi:hypothetical protein